MSRGVVEVKAFGVDQQMGAPLRHARINEMDGVDTDEGASAGNEPRAR